MKIDQQLHQQQLACHIQAHAVPLVPTVPSASPSMSPQEDRDTFEFAMDEFLGDLNPTVEGRRWLVATHLDKVVMQRAPVKVELEGHISVNLRTCRATLEQSTPKFAMVQAVESAFNTLGQMTKTPLIVDSGASCCISPHREDFVTYHDSKVKIKDLSGVNKVSGEGMLEWKVLDEFGREHTISIKGYHIPRASVRLLSPQYLYQQCKGCLGNQDGDQYVIRLQDGTILQAPYGAANLPLLKMSEESPKCFWSRCFSSHDVTPEIWATNVMNAANTNITAGQRELLRWHHRLSHAGLSTIHNLCRMKRMHKPDSKLDVVNIWDGSLLPCTHNVPASSCEGLLCAACEVAKAKRRSPGIRPTVSPPDKLIVLKQDDLKPGDCISCDHFLSPIPGRVVAESGHSSSSHGYTCGTIYVDHATGYVFVSNQKTTSAAETIRGKMLFEREASEVDVRVKRYHSDNGVFSSDEFKTHCQSRKQKLSFSGVGAKFQNGVAERAIQTVTNMARASMLHATMRWPKRSFLDLWPLAIQYAVWVHNRLPPNGAGWAPEELWSRTKQRESHLSRAHTFGCPVYVLDPKLQDGGKIPKWNSRARQGIFVGFSPYHSTNVPLILNPTTQHISPQYHVIFDDDFTTVSSVADEAFQNQQFEKLYELSRERYIDPMDVTATDDDVEYLPSDLLGTDWLSDEEKSRRQDRQDNHSVSQDSEGAIAGVPIAEESEGVWLPEHPLRPPSPVSPTAVPSAVPPTTPNTNNHPTSHPNPNPQTNTNVDPNPASPSNHRSLRPRGRNYKDGPVKLRSGNLLQAGMTCALVMEHCTSVGLVLGPATPGHDECWTWVYSSV
jgi:transposase InsO family protein